MYTLFDQQIGVDGTGAVVASPDHNVKYLFRLKEEIIILTGWGMVV